MKTVMVDIGERNAELVLQTKKLSPGGRDSFHR
jgi:hypothetical protein